MEFQRKTENEELYFVPSHHEVIKHMSNRTLYKNFNIREFINVLFGNRPILIVLSVRSQFLNDIYDDMYAFGDSWEDGKRAKKLTAQQVRQHYRRIAYYSSEKLADIQWQGNTYLSLACDRYWYSQTGHSVN